MGFFPWRFSSGGDTFTGDEVQNAVDSIETFDVTLTAAQVNANAGVGTIVVPGITGKSFIPTLVAMRSTVNAGGATLVQVTQETSGGVVLSKPVANLTNGTWSGMNDGTPVITTLGLPTATGKGLACGRTVADLTGTTALRVIVQGRYVTA